MRKAFWSVIFCLLLSSCGDFPEYRYDQSDSYCVLKIPFATGVIGRQYIGYFYLTSTLQFLDADPVRALFIGGPSHIDLEVGSVQSIEIGGNHYKPNFDKRYFHGELAYFGPAYLFDAEQSEAIYQAMLAGDNLKFHGRREIGKPYETELYNFFFDSHNAPFAACINRLLNENDLKQIEANRQEKL